MLHDCCERMEDKRKEAKAQKKEGEEEHLRKKLKY